jgi:hypothetical protein
MNRYRVFSGVARLGPGAVVLLSAAQFASREHNLDRDPSAKDDAKEFLCKAKSALEFKVGEVIGLDDLPRNLVGVVEPLGEAKTPIELHAVAKAKEIKRDLAEKKNAEKNKARRR